MSTLEEVKQRAEIDARNRGYHLTPNQKLLAQLLEGLKKNEERYGYHSCPCRLASGEFDIDRDIICPCDYRDPDVEEFGACYCGLYVSEGVYKGNKELGPVPERRSPGKQNRALGLVLEEPTKEETQSIAKMSKTDRKLLYCKVCGYLVFREEAPYVCPICRAKREMFAEIGLQINVETS